MDFHVAIGAYFATVASGGGQLASIVVHDPEEPRPENS